MNRAIAAASNVANASLLSGQFNADDRILSLQVLASGTAGVVKLMISNDGNTWVDTKGKGVGQDGVATASLAAPGILTYPVEALYWKVVLTGITAGTASIIVATG